MHAQSLLFVIPWTVAHQAPLSMEFSMQEYWNRLPCPTPRDLPHPRIQPESPVSPALQADSFTTEPSGKPLHENRKAQMQDIGNALEIRRSVT